MLSSQQDKVKNHALHNIYNMALQFIKCFWKPHLAFPYSPPSSGTISTIPYFSAPSHSCSLLFFPGNPRQKLWSVFLFFFSKDPSVKLGFLPLRWDRQVAPPSAVVPGLECQHSPRLSPLLPSAQGWVWVSSLLLDTCQHSTAHTQGNGGAAFHVATESGLC